MGLPVRAPSGARPQPEIWIDPAMLFRSANLYGMRDDLPRPGMSDTSEDARAVQFRVLRGMSPARKIALVEDANRAARRLAMAGISLRYPEATPEGRLDKGYLRSCADSLGIRELFR